MRQRATLIRGSADTEEAETVSYFVVINEAGSAWDDKCPMREQRGWNEHAVFMDALTDEHFVILGGPLKYSRHRAMLICTAPNETVLRKRLAEDPWMRS